MASNHTEHFSLNQWQADDQVLRTDFNEDNAKIDSALKDLAAAQAEKADQSALDALAAEVAKKAATAALDALSKKHGIHALPGDGDLHRRRGRKPPDLPGLPAQGPTGDAGGGLFRPPLHEVSSLDPQALARQDGQCLQTSYGTDYILTIESKGFRVYYNRDKYVFSNQKDTNYHYLAWK